MKYGARNQPNAIVTGIKKGSVMAQVNLKTTGVIDLASVLTVDSLADLDLKEGDQVKVIIKAIHVLIVKE